MADNKLAFQELENKIANLKLELRIQDEVLNSIRTLCLSKDKDFVYKNCNDALLVTSVCQVKNYKFNSL